MDTYSVDLILGSPPYEAARTYGIGFDLKGQAWVDWMVERWEEFQRVSRGLVVMVVAGQTRKFEWSATPALLMADLHRAGFPLRTPPIFRRVGIPGSGGPEWLRNDYEFCVVTGKAGRLEWSDNTAMGGEWKYPSGGGYSHRKADGTRVKRERKPGRANPGNVIDCGAAGGGNIGSKLAHENEAPYPERLAEFFIRSFCKPGGTVLDPFCGSGTTLAVAQRLGRNPIGIDVRESQIELTRRRMDEVEAAA
jgi:site-specific DNA-methyltransferase (adenine-specific)/site-specific DNA-methyltransferase (cytosine-N4-specific)